LLPSTHEDYFIVEREYLVKTLFATIKKIKVDEKWYSSKYTDVALALNEQTISSITEHYIRFGYFEHRMPYHILVDEQWYLAQYEDISRAVGSQIYASGQQHFEECGYREGRLPYPNFRLRSQSGE
jgi:hypothetical protein